MKEKVEARKNFKKYIQTKIHKLMSDPSALYKTMRKVESIKEKRMESIKNRVKVSEEVEKQMRERKQKLWDKKLPDQTLLEYKQQ